MSSVNLYAIHYMWTVPTGIVDSNVALRLCFFFFNNTATTEIYTLSLHDALPIFETLANMPPILTMGGDEFSRIGLTRSEEHTSELQSRFDLVCRLLLEKKKKGRINFNSVQFKQTVPIGSVKPNILHRVGNSRQLR